MSSQAERDLLPDQSDAIERWECPEHGFDGASFGGVDPPHCGCGRTFVWTRYERVDNDVIDAVRALAACYDEQLLRSDHVVDDLFGDGGREWLRLAADITGEYRTVLTSAGRNAIVRLLSADQERADKRAVLDEERQS